ncbi:MAG: glycosyltransferase family 2 protein [Candidatus Tectomicrobia bacterium]|nr:glycosyltransferase family 2 protein [Candidatus Tectomicrobia bacterium]
MRERLVVSVIVSTYNWPQTLDLVLSALDEQHYAEFEILVADDGSTDDTAALIRVHPAGRCRAIQHVWQPDNGFRKAEVVNKAILKAVGDYIIFLDGDCIPRPNWLAQHAKLAQPRRFVTGNRLLLTAPFTEHVMANRIAVGRYSFMDWWRRRDLGTYEVLSKLLYLPDGPWRHLRKRLTKYLFGSNFAAWRRDLVAVNGLDARYQGWGKEDNDLAARLIHAGVLRKDGRYATSVIHLWHELADRDDLGRNMQLLKAVVKSRAIRAVRGLDQHECPF